MNMKLAVEGRSGTEFVPLTADDTWVAKHGRSDEAETAALAVRQAERGMELYRMVANGRSRVTSVELTTSIPDGSLPVINPELNQPQGLNCYICLCDENSNCVCVPC